MHHILSAPDLLAFLQAGRTGLVRDFARHQRPAALARTLSGLAPKDAWAILSLLPEETQTRVFAAFERDFQGALSWLLCRNGLASYAPAIGTEPTELARLVPHAWITRPPSLHGKGT